MIVRESRVQAVARLLGCIVFVCAGIWCLGLITNPIKLAGLYFATAFFGVLALRYFWAIVRPGILTISAQGITQDLGWRRLHWDWNDIDHTEVVWTAAGRVSVCLLYTCSGKRVRLFGWKLPPEELQREIRGYQSA